jgi:GntR family transcriptional regulator
MDQLNRSNPTPIYEQLKLILRDQILLGKFPVGTQLPTEQEFCEMYQVSRITVSRALNDLAREGLVDRLQGKCSIVSRKRIQSQLNHVTGFSGHLKKENIAIRSRILAVEELALSPSLANTFRLPMDSDCKFMLFRRLRFVNGVPAVVMNTTVRAEVGQRMRAHNLEEASFYTLYEEILQRPVVRNEATLIPTLATSEICSLLHVEPNSPHFSYHSISFVEGDVPVEYVEAIYRGDMFEFSSNIYRLRTERIK